MAAGEKDFAPEGPRAVVSVEGARGIFGDRRRCGIGLDVLRGIARQCGALRRSERRRASAAVAEAINSVFIAIGIAVLLPSVLRMVPVVWVVLLVVLGGARS
jgi:hypothetical protein